MRVLLQLDQLPEPREVMIQLVGGLAVLLVKPMRRNAVFGRAMHVARPDLDLVELTTRAEDGRMERLVPVGLGAGDVILDPLLQRRPRVVDDAEHVVTIGDGVHQHTNREEVIDLLERLAALLHLLEDGPEVLGPADDLPAHDPGAAQFLGQRYPHALDGAVPLHPASFHLPCQLLVIVRLEVLEREVLELRLHACHAEAVRERRIQLAGFERDALALVGRQRIQRAHIVQPVGELDDDDARVARDRHQQFAIVLRLLLGGRAEVQRRDLGEAVHQIGDLVSEVATQHVQGDIGIFDDVV